MKYLLFIVIVLFSLTPTQCLKKQLRRQAVNHYQQISSPKQQSSKPSASVIGWVLSPILFIMSFVLIWNNQRKAATDQRRISLAKQTVQLVNPNDISRIKETDGKLVHIQGETRAIDPAIDSQTGILINEAIKIERLVEVKEMRQLNGRRDSAWVSENKYQFEKQGFGNDPGAWFITSGQSVGRKITIGYYQLSESLKQALPCNEIYFPNMKDAINIMNRMRNRIRIQPIVNGEYIYFPSAPGLTDSLGTLRIKFRYCKTGQASIISQSLRNTFVPYQADIAQNGKEDQQSQMGKFCFISNCTANLFSPISKINLISQKYQSAEEMLDCQQKKIECCKNTFRFLSFALMVFSICAFFAPLTTILGYVPLIGQHLSSAAAFTIFLASFLVCIPLFVLIIGICWVAFHPKVGLILLAIGIIGTLIVLAIILTNKKQTTKEVAKQIKHLTETFKTFLNQ